MSAKPEGCAECGGCGWVDPEPGTEEFCCDGRECGCYGKPTNPEPCPSCRPDAARVAAEWRAAGKPEVSP